MSVSFRCWLGTICEIQTSTHHISTSRSTNTSRCLFISSWAGVVLTQQPGMANAGLSHYVHYVF